MPRFIRGPEEREFPGDAKIANQQTPMSLDHHKSSVYLYVVSPTGDIVYVPQSYEMTRRNRKMEKRKHPMLMKGGLGRIGGEIVYEPETGSWIVDNESGRYSYRSDSNGAMEMFRTKKNLEAAAELMRHYGVGVTLKTKLIRN